MEIVEELAERANTPVVEGKNIGKREKAEIDERVVFAQFKANHRCYQTQNSSENDKSNTIDGENFSRYIHPGIRHIDDEK